jgi:hypothetical protein
MTINSEVKMKGKELSMTRFKGLSHYLPGGTKKNHAKPQSG